jgi:hypothetical protein
MGYTHEKAGSGIFFIDQYAKIGIYNSKNPKLLNSVLPRKPHGRSVTGRKKEKHP